MVKNSLKDINFAIGDTINYLGKHYFIVAFRVMPKKMDMDYQVLMIYGEVQIINYLNINLELIVRDTIDGFDISIKCVDFKKVIICRKLLIEKCK